MRGRLAAEQCPGAAGLHRGQVVRFEAGRRVADAVDAAKDSNKGTRPQAPLDLLLADPGREQLPPGYHPMRTARQNGQSPLHSGHFHPYDGKATTAAELTPL